MAFAIRVVGTGPGHKKYCSFIAQEAIAEAQVLVGGGRLLDEYARADQTRYVMDKDLSGAVSYIREQSRDKNVAVLVSGDTGIYSFAGYLARELEDRELEFIPGISSVQLMFARLKKPWQEAEILSTHGRLPADFIPAVRRSGVTAILTGHPYPPPVISRLLLDHGLPDYKAVLGVDLSYPDEQIIYSSLEEVAAAGETYINCIMVIFHE